MAFTNTSTGTQSSHSNNTLNCACGSKTCSALNRTLHAKSHWIRQQWKDIKWTPPNTTYASIVISRITPTTLKKRKTLRYLRPSFLLKLTQAQLSALHTILGCTITYKPAMLKNLTHQNLLTMCHQHIPVSLIDPWCTKQRLIQILHRCIPILNWRIAQKKNHHNAHRTYKTQMACAINALPLPHHIQLALYSCTCTPKSSILL